ncbi:glycosyl transferase family 1 [Capsulimonas corticalis]|uniref:Glycosyl transferase family 1 n=1 Tax=Capsulimonas corticalis TaxID=2219043 RepID=A0A402CPS8_9BACT|nr:glycosyltransferase family 4 protein [Capsulimonas corticalis]BDI32937.1 glycosyl transferase family 1 [Capsulimonas corticalis]
MHFETKRLRVLHVITHLAVGGAAETVIASCRMSHPEIESAICCGQTPAGEDSWDDLTDFAGIQVSRLPSLRRSVHPWVDALAYKTLTEKLRREKWDVVHTHGSKAGILGRMAASAAGVPAIVHTVHGWGHHERQSPQARWMFVSAERRAARITDRMIVVADANREKGLRDQIGVREQYVTVLPGIDIARFRDVVVDRGALRREFGIPEDAQVIGTISRLATQKAPEDFVRVASEVCKRFPKAHFVFIGDGPLRKLYLDDIKNAGLEDRMHLLGYRDDVPRLLRLFDVFLLTSLWEGLPRVFSQAMCASLPIVATNVDGAPEAIEDNVTGYLVEPKDVARLADRVIHLLENPKVRMEMGQKGLEAVDPKFSEREMVQRTEDVYWSCQHKKTSSVTRAYHLQKG